MGLTWTSGCIMSNGDDIEVLVLILIPSPHSTWIGPFKLNILSGGSRVASGSRLEGPMETCIVPRSIIASVCIVVAGVVSL